MAYSKIRCAPAIKHRRRSHIAMPLAAACLLAVACGDAEQQSLEPTAAGATVPAPTSTPPAPTPTEAQPTVPPPSVTVAPVAPTPTPATVRPTPAPNRPDALPLTPGEPARGGTAYRFGFFTFVTPAGYDFTWGVSVGDPSGITLLVLIHEATRSGVKIDAATGKENGRAQGNGLLTDPTLNAVFDALVASIMVDQ